jgi:3-(3-hydroxy-phenyl)propionate hydroxylase
LSEEIEALFAALHVGDEAFTPIIIGKGGRGKDDVPVVADPAGHIAAAYAAQEATFYLIRPDRHICARWKSICPVEVKQAFVQALGG